MRNAGLPRLKRISFFATFLLLLVLSNAANRVEAQPNAYVTTPDQDTLSVINTTTNTVITTVAVGREYSGIAITPDGKRVYTTNQVHNTVAVIDTATNTVITTIP